MNGNWDTHKCTDVSSEGSDKRVQIICIDLAEDRQGDRANRLPGSRASAATPI